MTPLQIPASSNNIGRNKYVAKESENALLNRILALHRTYINLKSE